MTTDQTAIAAAAAFSAESSAKEMKGKYLSFWTDNQLFGIPIADVMQIVGIQHITSIPDYPYYAKGVIDLRGSIIPVLDVRLRLGKEEAAYTERTCIIVINVSERFAGLIVDQVDEVAQIPDENISPPPKVNDGSNGAISAIAKQKDKVVLLLDTAKILSDSIF